MSTRPLMVDDAQKAVSEARDRLTDAEGKVAEAEGTYQMALMNEAVGQAKAGTAARAKSELESTQHQQELAAAGLAAAEADLLAAEVAQDERRLAAIAEEAETIGTDFAEAERALVEQLNALLGTLDQVDRLNDSAARLRAESATLASRRGLTATHIKTWHAELTLNVVRRLGLCRSGPARAHPVARLV